MEISGWTVAYDLPEGRTASRPVSIPHAWRQEVDVRWEGPAIYEASATLPADAWLLLEGVSYNARVFLNGELAGEHAGIWDAFAIDARRWSGQAVAIRVEVVKNGGPTYPVKDVLSGFLPYVFHTFGGIFKPVHAISSKVEPILGGEASACRIRAEGTRLLVDGEPWFARGVLTWGWYPDIGHPNPDEATIRKEIALARQLGFNLFKFCLWLPPHRFLEQMAEEGMAAWIELPLWLPTGEPAKLAAMKEELRRIVLQYRRHPNVLLWTCGCELSESTPAEFRRELVAMVAELAGNSMVRDNSGGAEMYGGDPREYGAFYDYHPYCDLPFYPPVLESLRNGPREPKPILLGEFNDYDTHRDLARIARERPYWASPDPAQNDVGVRWQHDLPGLLDRSRFARRADPDADERLRAQSHRKAAFLREFVHGQVMLQPDFAGYVVTGWIDTPISSSGYLDNWFDAKPLMESGVPPRSAIVIPRRPPWVEGGNRPGWQDPLNRWEGWNRFEIVHFDRPSHELEIFDVETKIENPSLPVRIELPGDIEAAIFARPDWTRHAGWDLHDPRHVFSGLELPGGGNLLSTVLDDRTIGAWRNGNCVALFLDGEGALPMPFWRESIHAVEAPQPWLADFAAYDWSKLLPISPDRALDRAWLEGRLGMKGQVLLNRIDTRTYAEHPYAMRFENGTSVLVATTIRPFGGLGVQPYGVRQNPVGSWLLDRLLADLAGR